jgi:cytochrome c oxidase subunit 4
MRRDGADIGKLWLGPFSTWVALMLLFAINLGSAYIPLGEGNLVFNLFVAAIMAIVLIVFLMDLRNAQILVRVTAVAGLFWMALMFSLTFSDYLTRN